MTNNQSFYSRSGLGLQLVDEVGHPLHVLPVLVGRELHLLDPPVRLERPLVRLGEPHLRHAWNTDGQTEIEIPPP